MRLSTAVTATTIGALLAIAACGWACAQETPASQPTPTAAPAAATVPAIYVEGIRVELDGKARYTGNVAMVLTVHGRDPKLVSVDVIPKMAADDIAKDLYKELTLTAGSDFKVKQSGSRVTIKKANKNVPNLSLKITSQTILGVSFLIDQD